MTPQRRMSLWGNLYNNYSSFSSIYVLSFFYHPRDFAGYICCLQGFCCIYYTLYIIHFVPRASCLWRRLLRWPVICVSYCLVWANATLHTMILTQFYILGESWCYHTHHLSLPLTVSISRGSVVHWAQTCETLVQVAACWLELHGPFHQPSESLSWCNTRRRDDTLTA